MPSAPLFEPGRLAWLAARATALVPPAGRAVLGIAGAPGAGKSTLAEALVAAIAAQPPAGLGHGAVAHLPMDGFHLADVQLERLGLLGRKGAPETFDGHGYVALLQRVRAGGAHTVFAPGFDRRLEQPVAAAIAVEPAARLVVTEGNYLLLDEDPWSAARRLVDEVWYVELSEEERLRRLLERHVAFGKPPDAAREWVLGSDQANAGLVVASRGRADLVVPIDWTSPGSDMTPTPGVGPTRIGREQRMARRLGGQSSSTGPGTTGARPANR